jgi:hypothetical protein
MKRFLLTGIAAVFCFACFAHAGDDPNMLPPIAYTSVSTNAAAGSTTLVDTDTQWGWFDTLIVDIGGQSSPAPTCTVAVATVASLGTGASRTILSALEITADGSYPIRDLATTQAGVDIAATPSKIPLVGDKIRVNAYNSNTTNATLTPVTLKVYLIKSGRNY